MRSWLILAVMICLGGLYTQSLDAEVLFDGRNKRAWEAMPADGVKQSITYEERASGNIAMRVDFSFEAGAGYAVSQLNLKEPIELPENFVLSFDLRGDTPANTLEVKLLDPTGENVWWVNRRSYDFPSAWETIRLKRRHFVFAWGPVGGEHIHKELGAIEIVVTASSGGQGAIWVDNLELEPLPPAATGPLKLSVRSASAVNPSMHQLDPVKDPGSIGLETTRGDHHEIVLDLGAVREFSGLIMGWSDQRFPRAYSVRRSVDGEHWDEIASMRSSNGGIDGMLAPECEARYLKVLTARTHEGEGVVLETLKLLPVAASSPVDEMLKTMAPDEPRGTWPMTYENRQVFWNVIGLPDRDEEALLSEHGSLEVHKGGFTIEPFVRLNGKVLSWADGRHHQALSRDALPISTVVRDHDSVRVSVTPLPCIIDEQQVVLTRYRVESRMTETKRVALALAVRPVQVLPPWQNLNIDGGYTPIHTISVRDDEHGILVNEQTPVVSGTPISATAVGNHSEGQSVSWLRQARLPHSRSAEDASGLASGVMLYERQLEPGESFDVMIATPLGSDGVPSPERIGEIDFDAEYAARENEWEQRLGPIFFEVEHPSAQAMLDSLRAQVGYILINKDGDRIQPGSRTYERSWIRDGALTGTALINLGQAESVKRYFEWYANYQYDNGKIPCVVDRRGPDPVDEHDSTGQFIYLAKLLLDHTGDQEFIRRHYEKIRKGVAYMEELRNQRLTDAYMGTEFEGLVPESISHEGYSAKPMHAYWDNTFVLRGFADAASIAKALGETQDAEHYEALADAHRRAMVRSIEMVTSERGLDYIPGCAELGDFDPPSTAIMISVGNLRHDLPESLMRGTFDRYWQGFAARMMDEREWFDYTPYELRVMSTMVRLGYRERAHQMYAWLAQDQHPPAWKHWAEIAYRDDRAPRFIGDMPHTWVGAGFINATRAMFVAEDEKLGQLRLGLGIPATWLDGQGVRVTNAPTRYGRITYSMQRIGNEAVVRITGDANPPNGCVVYLPDPIRDDVHEHMIKTLPAQIRVPLSPEP